MKKSKAIHFKFTANGQIGHALIVGKEVLTIEEGNWNNLDQNEKEEVTLNLLKMID